MAVGKAGWNPDLVEREQTLDDLMFTNYIKEIFLDSDTKVACISGAPSEIPQDLQKRYGLSALGAADGPAKNAILGGNNARLYNFQPQQRSALQQDKLAAYRELYARHGAGRTNLAYGYAMRRTA